MANEDVYKWLEKRTEAAQERATMLLAARQLAKDGYSYREIARALGVSHNWVQRALEEQES